MKKRAQTSYEFPVWGGKRKGAGRPRQGDKRVAHVKRKALAGRFPVHVTVRMKAGTYGLRSQRCFSQLSRAFYAAREHLGARLCEFAVLGNHIHFLVEARDAESLSRAMQGLGVRMAKALHRVMGRHGRVYADRYHAHILKTPSEVRNARHYVLQNARHHRFIAATIDRFSSAAHRELVAAPRTWLLGRAGPGR